MKQLTLSSAAVALVALIAGACTADIPSAATPTDPALAKGGPSAEYTSLDVGALLPGAPSQARGVNDAGDVVGSYDSGSGIFPFAFVSASPVTLGGGPGNAYGISNGSPAYVIGGSNNFPARWSLADPSQPTLLPRTAAEVTAGLRGLALGVNGAGDAVGWVGPNAAMWLADGTRIPITTPTGFVGGEGRGIDDAGLAVFQFSTSPSGGDRGHLRLASGTLIILPPVGDDVVSFVNDLSEVANGLVYVSGSTRSSTLDSRAVRWTVDAATGVIVATDILETIGGHGLSVSDAGEIAGFFDARRVEAFLWSGTDVLKLAPPKGGREGQAYSLSQSGQYVAGLARFSAGEIRAVRWTILTP